MSSTSTEERAKGVGSAWNEELNYSKPATWAMRRFMHYPMRWTFTENVEFENHENFYNCENGSVVLTPSHQSFFDIYLDGQVLCMHYGDGNYPYYLPTQKLFQGVLGKVLDYMPIITVPYDQENEKKESDWRAAVNRMKDNTKAVLSEGNNIIAYFQSGRITTDGKIPLFRSASLKDIVANHEMIERPIYCVPTAHSYDNVPAIHALLENDRLLPNQTDIASPRSQVFCTVGEPIEVQDLLERANEISPGNTYAQAQDILRNEVVSLRKHFPQHWLLYALTEEKEGELIVPKRINVDKKQVEDHFASLREEVPEHLTEKTFRERDDQDEIEKATRWLHEHRVMDAYPEDLITGMTITSSVFQYYANAVEDALETLRP